MPATGRGSFGSVRRQIDAMRKSRYLEQTQGAEKAPLFCSTILCQNRGMIYGYARVSTGAQDLTSQLAQLKAAGCEKVFREKLTGTTADRPQLQKLITKLASGDVVIIPAVDRLSRDTTDLLIIAARCRRPGRASVHWPSRSSIPR